MMLIGFERSNIWRKREPARLGSGNIIYLFPGESLSEDLLQGRVFSSEVVEVVVKSLKAIHYLIYCSRYVHSDCWIRI